MSALEPEDHIDLDWDYDAQKMALSKMVEKYLIDKVSERANKRTAMDAELRTKWVEALRSGRYEQGKGELRSPEDKYCCLGVLCDIIAPDGWKLEPGSLRYEYHYGGGSSWSMLPSTALAFAGIENGLDFQRALIVMNDEQETFSEIARWIEEHM